MQRPACGRTQICVEAQRYYPVADDAMDTVSR
jgi:hypothetical protein